MTSTRSGMVRNWPPTRSTASVALYLFAWHPSIRFRLSI